jgi:hypothetical protein
MHRRKFIKTTGTAALGLSAFNLAGAGLFMPGESFISQRPPISKRNFTSKAIEAKIVEVKAAIADPELAWMFENCYPNTLDTTVEMGVLNGKADTFVITGDIHAMWLRDSTAQVWPYMPLINDDAGLKLLIQGLINRQASCVLLDPYANAFNKDATQSAEWNDDEPKMRPGLHERKWEIDSLCYVMRLAHEYWRLTGDNSLFDAEWQKTMKLIVETFKTEQRLYAESPYYFIRKTSAMIDAPVFGGTGRPIKPTGMICSMFRPSDDATLFPFLVPSNLFAAQELRHISDIFKNSLNDETFASECLSLASEIEKGISKFAITNHLDFGEIYAYEVDGFGNKVFMDDANVPSLMSLAYLGIHQPGDEIYQNTRKFLLSENNPYFLKGKAAEGQASPHTGKENIWPMGIILRAMTSTDDREITNCLKMLKSTHAGKGFMHESFDKDDASKFSRSWFAWANTLFGEMIIKIYNERKLLLKVNF